MSTRPDDGGDPHDPAAELKARWTKLAGTRSCHFFVASHPGWRDADRWRAQADSDVSTMLLGVDPDWLAGVDVLEIGCGVGRLAVPLLDRAKSWSGCDISPGMVAEARQAVEGDPRARVAESTGSRVPEPLRDRRYGLVVCWAVLIHCPLSVVESLVTDAVALTAPGGRFRCQMLADMDDPEGITGAPAETEEVHRQMLEVDAGSDSAAAEPEDAQLAHEGEYLGHAFRFAEAKALFDRFAGEGQATLYRFDRRNMYADWVRSSPRVGLGSS